MESANDPNESVEEDISEQSTTPFEVGHDHAVHPSNESMSSYICSFRFAEFCFTLTPGLLGLILEYGGIAVRDRPIPILRLESGEVIVNQTYNEEFDGETVTTNLLIVIAFVVPYFGLLFVSKWTGEMHEALCSFQTGVGTTLMMTDIIKLYVGYLRPVFLDFCQPNGSFTRCTDPEEADEARKSFPSGHSSLTVSGLLLLCLFLDRKFGVSQIQSWRTKGASDNTVHMVYTSEPSARRIITVLCYTPMLVAMFVATSRLVDNKHFPADVVGGALLGGSLACWSHRIYFPAPPQAMLSNL